MPLALAHRRFGSHGPRLLVLHGLFGCARNWQGVAERLSTAHCVYTLDLRNHGDSPWDEAMSYADMAGDVRRFIRDHELEPCAVLGHSMGGKVAMRLALEGDPRVDALIAVDVAPVRYTHPTHAWEVPDLEAARSRLARRYPLGGPVTLEDVCALLPGTLPNLDEHFDWRVNVAAALRNLAALDDFPVPKGRTYEAPALFVAAGLSPYLRPEHHPALRRLFPRAEIASIPDAGHWIHADRPERLVALVGEFLARAHPA